MGYKILVSIGISFLLSVTYALDNPVFPDSSFPPALNQEDGSSLPSSLKEASKALASYQHCFKDTTWVVPPETLRAYLYTNANYIPVVDQTVWVISKFSQGYFFGIAYSAINNSSLSQRYLIGSVTSEGKVYITFYSGSSTSTDLVTGLGSLILKSSGQCLFIMQMNSGQNGVSGLAHWSYMIPVKPGDVFYSNLPGTKMSVPQFLAQF